MRTTLTLDEDVAAELQRIERETGLSWKKVVNRALRAGLQALGAAERRPVRRRRTKPVRLGTPRIADVSNVHEVLSLVEGDARR